MPAPEFELLEKKNKKLTAVTLVSFLLISAVFLYFAETYEKNPLISDQNIDNILDFKLSKDDLVALSGTHDKDNWINVGLIESQQHIHPVKIKHKIGSTSDFQLYSDGQIYNLFRFEKSRKPIHSLFKQARTWGLGCTHPQLVQLRMNEILVGVYIMEMKVYGKIRDDRGNHFLRLNSNSEELKSCLYLVTQEGIGDRIVSQYFDWQQMAAAFIYFGLFCYNDILDFDLLWLQYRSDKKKYVPFLSIESVISTLETQNKTFKPPPPGEGDAASGLSEKNITDLLNRAHFYKYEDLIKIVLTKKLAVM